MTTTNVTSAQTAAGLTSGSMWTGNTITYSAAVAGSTWAAGYGANEPGDPNYGVLSPDQRAQFNAAVEMWDALIAPSMNAVSDTGATPGQIRIAFTDVTARQGNGTAGYAYLPPSSGSGAPINGDIWIDEQYKPNAFADKTFGFELLLHESGHALGLKHPFEAPALPAAYDSKTYTVMSYTAEDYFYSWSGGGGNISYSVSQTVSLTPMVLDIQAIQGVYGADKATASGNTVYSFTDGDLVGRRSIYDAGGVDTLDLSQLSRGSHIDLRPGAYSDLAYYNVDDQIDDLAATYGEGFRNFIEASMTNPARPAYQWERNLGLAFSTTIENVTGTAFADKIIGNSANNVIIGGAGADTMSGSKGNDKYYVDNAKDVVLESAQYGTDYVLASVNYQLRAGSEVEKLSTTNTGSSGALNLTGNDLAQVILGNQGTNRLMGLGGADELFGYGGTDVLHGGLGKDKLNGGLGNDYFVFDSATGSTNIDTIEDFHNVSGDNDAFRLDNAVFAKLGGTGAMNADFFKANASGVATDGNDYVVYNTTNGTLSYDTNGNASGGIIAIAVLISAPTLTGADFFVV